MRKYGALTGLVLVGISLLAACGDSGNSGGSGGGSTSTDAATTTAASTSTGMMMGDGNDTFETAEELDLSPGIADVESDIADISEDVDFYTFEGTAGQQLIILVTAHPEMTDPMSADFIDPVVTLYDADQKQIAFDDDPFPRLSQQDPAIYTVLPKAGKYFIKVEDFHHYDPTAMLPDPLPAGEYTLTVGGFNTMVLNNEAEPNNDGATATPITLTKGAMGYGGKLPFGTFSGADATDWFTFTAPADLMPAAKSRASTWMIFFPGSADGSGSTSELETVQLIDSTNMAVVAEVKPSAETGDKKTSTDWDTELFAPITPGTKYFVKITRAGAGGANDFYYINLIADIDSNPLEQKDVDMANNNDTLATAETLTTMLDDTMMFDQAFLEADLNLGAADVDFYRLPSGGHKKLFAFCSAQSRGSGIRGLKATVLKADGTPLPQGSATEIADVGASISGTMDMGVDIPAGESELVLKIEATAAADATVTGRFYNCGISLADP